MSTGETSKEGSQPSTAVATATASSGANIGAGATRNDTEPKLIIFDSTFDGKPPLNRLYPGPQADLKWNANETANVHWIAWIAKSELRSTHEVVIANASVEGGQTSPSNATDFITEARKFGVKLQIATWMEHLRTTGAMDAPRKPGTAHPGDYMTLRLGITRMDRNNESWLSNSGVFGLADQDTPTRVWSNSKFDQDDIDGFEVPNFVATSPSTLPTSSPTSDGNSGHSSNDTSSVPTAQSSHRSSSGLSAGGIAGVAVGCGLALLLIIGTVAWFTIVRKRRRQEQQQQQQHESQDKFLETKDLPTAHGHESPYAEAHEQHMPADEPHASYEDEDTSQQPTRRSSVAQGVPHNVAHLVEDGMTADEIRRLEEEERHLDDEIARAGQK